MSQSLFVITIPLIPCRQETVMKPRVTVVIVKEETMRLSLVFKHNRLHFSEQLLKAIKIVCTYSYTQICVPLMSAT